MTGPNFSLAQLLELLEKSDNSLLVRDVLADIVRHVDQLKREPLTVPAQWYRTAAHNHMKAKLELIALSQAVNQQWSNGELFWKKQREILDADSEYQQLLAEEQPTTVPDHPVWGKALEELLEVQKRGGVPSQLAVLEPPPIGRTLLTDLCCAVGETEGVEGFAIACGFKKGHEGSHIWERSKPKCLAVRPNVDYAVAARCNFDSGHKGQHSWEEDCQVYCGKWNPEKTLICMLQLGHESHHPWEEPRPQAQPRYDATKVGHRRYLHTKAVHPDIVVRLFLEIHHYWFDGTIGPNAFTGMRDRAVAYLSKWIETGSLPTPLTELEYHCDAKFTEWLNSCWEFCIQNS